MSGKNYVGATPASAGDLITKLGQANLLAAATPSQTSAHSDVNTAAALKGGKTYIDTLTATFSSRTYYQTQDALNIPTASIGQLSGVAALDSNGKIPLAQIPAVGTGYILGPFGPTAGFAASTGSTPVKIADWTIGVQSLTFEPWVFCTILAGATNMGRPVIEVGISNGSTSVYADQTIIGRGVGRTFWNDGQVVNVMTVPAAAGHSGADPTVYTPTYNVFCSAWLFDSQGQTVSVSDGSILSGGIWLVRTQL